MRLPNLFIVGAAKGGTTSLWDYLDSHPQVYMAPIKEPNYFSQADMVAEKFNREYRFDVQIDLGRYYAGGMSKKLHIANIQRWEQYIRLFEHATDETFVGEASTSYLVCPSTPERIFADSPHAKIIMILRNPIERAFSHYLMNVRTGRIQTEDFLAEVLADYGRTEKGWGVSRLYLELGLYLDQVVRYMELFPRNNLLILLYDDYRRDPAATMQSVCDFLGIYKHESPVSTEHGKAAVPRFKRINYYLAKTGLLNVAKRLMPDSAKTLLRNVVYSSSRLPRITAQERDFLKDFYAEDVRGLSKLLNRPLEHWLE